MGLWPLETLMPKKTHISVIIDDYKGLGGLSNGLRRVLAIILIYFPTPALLRSPEAITGLLKG